MLAELRGIRKEFEGAAALDAVDFDVRGGEVHVLAGENGAGKSTLIRILGGVLLPDAGSVTLAAGTSVAVIHQELSLSPSLSVADNVFLGREVSRGWGALGVVRSLEQRRQADKLLARVGLPIDPRRTVGSLSLAQRQLVEVAKALGRQAAVLVMDEPTSALPAPDAERLFGLVGRLRASGSGIVYISHRMEEVYRLADRITVLRDGRRVVTAAAGDLPRDGLVRAMVGRSLAEQIPRGTVEPGAELLRVESLTVGGGSGARLSGVSLSVRAGEIVGVAGLAGSGASELLHALFGDARRGTGVTVRVRSAARVIRTPREAISMGMALVPADRTISGLCMGMSVEENLTLPGAARLRALAPRRPGTERDAADRAIAALGIRCRSPGQAVRTLSGGNQQKVALGKWSETRPTVLLLDDPTRGVDIGAKHEIYGLLRRWTAEGIGVVLTSSELPELLGLSDRVVVLHRGRIATELTREYATPERVIAAAMGSESEEAA
jgi:ribose transport system ATP-binding protein